jgi:hypothetical protein
LGRFTGNTLFINLEDLHFAILNSVGFDNDHLYEFFVSRTESSYNKKQFDEENAMVFDTTLEGLYPLGKNLKLFYMFDYGDSWTFKVTKTRRKAKEPIEGVSYPDLIDEKGEKPIQYPDWDE